MCFFNKKKQKKTKKEMNEIKKGQRKALLTATIWVWLCQAATVLQIQGYQNCPEFVNDCYLLTSK